MTNEENKDAEFEPLQDTAPTLDGEAKDAVEEAVELDPVEQLQSEVKELNDRWMRSQAELENVRRRARRDVEDQIKFASQNVIGDLLEVVDNLNRALSASNGNEAESQGVVSGVRMVVQQFEDVLQRHGCVRMKSEGQKFDPNVHEAIQMVPNDLPSGMVVQEVRSGYQLHDRVIRPAQVIVSAGK